VRIEDCHFAARDLREIDQQQLQGVNQVTKLPVSQLRSTSAASCQ
jgi:hypothetical protein